MKSLKSSPISKRTRLPAATRFRRADLSGVSVLQRSRSGRNGSRCALSRHYSRIIRLVRIADAVCYIERCDAIRVRGKQKRASSWNQPSALLRHPGIPVLWRKRRACRRKPHLKSAVVKHRLIQVENHRRRQIRNWPFLFQSGGPVLIFQSAHHARFRGVISLQSGCAIFRRSLHPNNSVQVLLRCICFSCCRLGGYSSRESKQIRNERANRCI